MAKIKLQKKINNIDYVILESSSEEDIKHTLGIIDLASDAMKSKKIVVNINDLISRIVILGSKAEMKAVSRQANASSEDWFALYNLATNSIFINIKKCKEDNFSNKSLYSIVHELGHAVHLNYIAKDGKEYFDKISISYKEFLDDLKDIIEKIKSKLLFKDRFAKKQKNKLIKKFNKFLDSQDEEIKNEILSNFNKIKKDQETWSKFLSSNTGITSKEEKSKADFIVKDLYCFIKSIKMIYVSEYALVNNKEDFAELFAHWVLDEKLSTFDKKRIEMCFLITKKEGKPVVEQKLSLVKNYIKLLISGI